MELSTLQAQYTQAAGDTRRAIVLQGIRRLPPHEVTILNLEKILDEQEFQILCETPFSELFPTSEAMSFAVRNADMRNEMRIEPKTRVKKAPPTNGVAHTQAQTKAPKAPKEPKAPRFEKQSAPEFSTDKSRNSDLEKSILRCISTGGDAGVSAQEIADAVGLEIKQIRPTVNSLLSDEAIISSGKTRGTRYHITK